MVHAHVRCNNARAWASALSHVHVQNHGITDLSHLWAPLPGSWLAAHMADLTPDLQVYLSWGSIAKSFHSLRSLCFFFLFFFSLFVSCFHVILGLPGPRFPSACMSQAVFWLHPWSIPGVHIIPAFSPSGWGPQCQAMQVAHWTWCWQRLPAWHCKSVWSLPSFHCRRWRFGFVNGQVSLA